MTAARTAAPAALASLALMLAMSGCTPGEQLLPEKGAIVLATGSDLSSSGVRQDLIHDWERRTGRTVRIVNLPDHRRRPAQPAAGGGPVRQRRL
ncbi:hypothetical protein RB199_34240 [Streptomyces libani]